MGRLRVSTQDGSGSVKSAEIRRLVLTRVPCVVGDSGLISSVGRKF